jgi:hypothetical protein
MKTFNSRFGNHHELPVLRIYHPKRAQIQKKLMLVNSQFCPSKHSQFKVAGRLSRSLEHALQLKTDAADTGLGLGGCMDRLQGKKKRKRWSHPGDEAERPDFGRCGQEQSRGGLILDSASSAQKAGLRTSQERLRAAAAAAPRSPLMSAGAKEKVLPGGGRATSRRRIRVPRDA